MFAYTPVLSHYNKVYHLHRSLLQQDTLTGYILFLDNRLSLEASSRTKTTARISGVGGTIIKTKARKNQELELLKRRLTATRTTRSTTTTTTTTAATKALI